MTVPTRPVLRWHGGKWKLAPWIISHFPPHRVYVEPYGGAASVLMRKPPAYADIYNDLDDEVVGLFRVLRDPRSAERLEAALALTPFARSEFDLSFEPCDDPIERARRLIVRSFLAGGTRGVLDISRTQAGFNGGSARSRSGKPQPCHAREWSTYGHTLPAFVTRLRGVVIERRPAREVMLQHDGQHTLFYVDPPYLPVTRSKRSRRVYRHEMSHDDHAELLGCLRDLTGMVVLSGYPAPLYEALLIDWCRVETQAMADGARTRTEVLWLNPACTAALARRHAGACAPLFSHAEVDL